MLTKNGLFNRKVEHEASANHQASVYELMSPDGQSTSAKNEHLAYITPGHVAAIRSAVTVSANRTNARMRQQKSEYTTQTRAELSKVLLIGSDVEIYCAEIAGCESLMVEGSIETTLDSHALLITESGYFAGKAEVENAEIRGNFHGELYVKNLLVIHADASVIGKIRYGHLSIEEGGKLAGDVAMASDSIPEQKSSVAQIRPHLNVKESAAV